MKRPTLSPSLLLPIAVVALAGCTAYGPTGPGGQPPAEPAAAPTSSPAPAESGDWTPDDYWFENAAAQLHTLSFQVEEWEAEGCTVARAVDSGVPCGGALGSMSLALTASGALLEQLDQLAPGAADAVGTLPEVRAAVEQGLPAAESFAAAECNWELTEDCTSDSEQIVAAAIAAVDAFEDWDYLAG